MIRNRQGRLGTLIIAGLAVVMMTGCAALNAGRSGRMAGKPVNVTVAKENLRKTPGGAKLGEVALGAQLKQVLRRGNWVQVTGTPVGQSWIWAPSLGYDLVNPVDIHTWLGSADHPLTIHEVTDVFGPQSTVETLSGAAVEYVWSGGMDVFGTDNLREVRLAVDRATRKVFRVTMVLSPYEGKTKEALVHVGLSAAKSTSIDTDHARYDGKFAGIDRVNLYFYNGDFLKIGKVEAWRYDPDLWQNMLSVSEQKAVPSGKGLNWTMTLTNIDGSHTFASPTANVELVYHGQSLGKWTLGPIDVRVAPGQVALASFPIPIDVSGKDVKEIAGRADLVDMLVLPAK